MDATTATELERLRAIERRARRLVEALGEDDRPRLEAIEAMRAELGLPPLRRTPSL